ncbi:MAG: ATP-binding protein [Anaerolineae bacterium]|nr:ATP-binding protein [Anaerolineae bacterium]
MVDPDILRTVPLFEDLPDEELRWVSEISEEIVCHPGQVLIAEGETCPERNSILILLEGRLQAIRHVGKQEIVLATFEAGTFVGEISMLGGLPEPATIRTLCACRVLELKGEAGLQLFLKHPALAHTAIRVLIERVQSLESLKQQRDKMSSLGAMAAGMAHELNNPASSILRALEQARTTFNQLRELVADYYVHLDEDQQNAVNDLITRVAAPDYQTPVLDSLARSDREEEFNAWLAQQTLQEAWMMAHTFVSAGLEIADLESLAAIMDIDTLCHALTWINEVLTFLDQLTIAEQSSKRISEIVQAFKAYSYMDQTPQQDIDIHEGLDNTLLILSHRLGDSVRVIREYDHNLPRITAFGGELNQVWTNLLSNAIDAVNGNGMIWVRTAREGDQALVEIADSGPGIPSEIQPHLFEPFFTTKDVGKGIGLGLNIAHRLVTARHQGTICVLSQPGETRFQVRLPIGPPAWTP